jgi:hypothetical protein
MNDMGDKWWTSRMFILLAVVGITCYLTGWFEGHRVGLLEGYLSGYTDCKDWVIAYIHGMK